MEPTYQEKVGIIPGGHIPSYSQLMTPMCNVICLVVCPRGTGEVVPETPCLVRIEILGSQE